MRGNSLATVFSGFCFLLPPMLVLSSTSVAPLIVVAAIAACLSVWRSERSFPAPDLALVAIFGTLLLWAATTTLWTIDGASALILAVKLAILFLAGLLLLCTALLLEPEERRRTGRWMVIGFALGVAVMISERLTGNFLHYLVAEPEPDRSPLSVLSLLNRGATGLAIIVWPVTAILVRGPVGKWALILPLLLLGLLGFYQSMAAVLGLIAGLAFALIAALNRRIGSNLLLAALVAVFVLAPPAAQWLYGTALNQPDFLGQSGQHRLSIWLFTAERIAEKPILGWGLESSPHIPNMGAIPFAWTTRALPSHPHNAILQLWLELGAIGALIGMMLALLLAFRLSRLSREDRITGQAQLVCALVIAGIAYGIWQSQWVATLFAAGLLFVLGRRCRESEKESAQDTITEAP